MGICTSNVYDQKQVICTVKKPLKYGKNQKELQEWVTMNKCKAQRRVTELYEAAILNPLSITVVNLNLIRLDSVTCRYLALVFSFCPNVTILKLWKCNLGAKGVGLLSKTMKELTQLQVLVLDDNALETVGARHLADSIAYFSALHTFSCRSNELQCEGVRLLAERMSYLSNLTVLTLDDNDMTSYGLDHLLTSLDLSKLERLGLSYNRITDCGVQSLIQCVGRLNSLETLNIQGNIVNVSAADELMRAFPNVNIS